jgi:arginine decarboxylase
LALPPEFRELLHLWGAAADITEVLGIDDIHAPRDQVQRAQVLAAQAYGAQKTQFLVNGSTVGNQTMLLSTVGPDDTVLVAENSHRSVFSGLLLSGARHRLLATPIDGETAASLPPTPQQVERALTECPQAKALFITTPTYYGAAAEISEIVDIAHARGTLVLVDEAWGSHLAFSPALPESAVTAGADMVVQSTHKLTAGLTQAAMLHYRTDTIDVGRVSTVLRHLQTSSPSSLLVASIDCARRQMALHGKELVAECLRLASLARAQIETLDGLSSPTHPKGDQTKLLVNATERGYSGYELALFLRQQAGIELELSDPHQVLLLITPGHTPEHIEHLISALGSLPKKARPFQDGELKGPYGAQTQDLREPSRLTVRDAFHARSITLKLEKAVDRTCGELLYCYPPGVPLVCPGQRLSPEAIDYIKTQRRLGGSVQGGVDPTLETVLVVENNDD